MKAVHESNFKEQVIEVLQNGGLYIGASAGALILSPTIALASEIEPDENEVGLSNLNGMNLIEFEILPHYTPELESEVKTYQAKTPYQVKVISNEEILVTSPNLN